MNHTEKPESGGPRTTVTGVGGGDINATNHMIVSGLQGVDYIVAERTPQPW